MKYPEERFLFTVKDVSEICGVSRATLLRMEDEGFLTPCRIDPDSGYRYYDADNITCIGQYKLIMGLGVSRKEARDLYLNMPGAKQLLEEQKQKINRLQRLINELEMRINHDLDYSCSYVNLPEMTCYCASLEADAYEDMEAMAYDIYQKAVKEGFHVDVTEPLFVLMPDAANKYMTMCIPLIGCDKPDSRIRTFPACNAFSMVIHGGYSVTTELETKFRENFAARHLRAAGPARAIALVAPYTGEHFRPDDYCGEMVIPIETDGVFVSEG